jgi:hypothetical protein
MVLRLQILAALDAYYHLVRKFCLSVSYPNRKDETVATNIQFCLFFIAKTWSLTLRSERMLGEFENGKLSRMLGPDIQEVIEKWNELRSE